MSRLIFIQPIIASYREQLLLHLGSRFDLFLAYDMAGPKAGFSSASIERSTTINAPILRVASGRLSYQLNIVSRPKRGDRVIIFADPRFVSYWFLLIASRLRGFRVFSHGQGGYSHPRPNYLRRLMYRAMTTLSHRYICYNEHVKTGMLEMGCPERKLRSAENSIAVREVVRPDERDYAAPGILFVGRLRHGCGLDKLIEAVERLRQEGLTITLEVIGSGDLLDHYRSNHGHLAHITFHGAIFSDDEIARVSLKCRVGCYPGDAGLSVVHFFALSLPAVVHSSIECHMGPEPSYVTDGHNGYLFSRESVGSLTDTIRSIWATDSAELLAAGRRAFETYEDLNSPALGVRFEKILLE